MGPLRIPGVPTAAQRFGFGTHHRHCRGKAGFDGDGHQAFPAQPGDRSQLDSEHGGQQLSQALIGAVNQPHG